MGGREASVILVLFVIMEVKLFGTTLTLTSRVISAEWRQLAAQEWGIQLFERHLFTIMLWLSCLDGLIAHSVLGTHRIRMKSSRCVISTRMNLMLMSFPLDS